MVDPKKVKFESGTGYNKKQYEAYWNGKEYKGGMVYMTITPKDGGRSRQASYSKEQERFVEYYDLETAKDAARALDIIE